MVSQENESAPVRVDRKLEQLQAKFSIDDRDGLRAALGQAMWAMAENTDPVPDFRECDTLDELVKPLEKIVNLLSDPLNGNRLAQYWRTLSPAEQYRLPFYLPDFVRDLQFIGQTAIEAHREREQKSGPLPARDLAAAIEVLANYWTHTLGRNLALDHNWGDGTSREPHTESEQFIWLAIAYFAPDRCDGLRTALRAFGKRRNKP
jgi:hypothetical protein